MEIKPIETVYRGYRFRSRLEARWAVFFTELNIPFCYELQGYELSDGSWYLPDFWLPQHDCWIEIKPNEPIEEEILKLVDVVNGTDKRGFIFFGDVWVPGEPDDESAYAYWPRVPGYDTHYWWCECPACGKLDILWSGLVDRMECECDKRHVDQNFNSPRLRRAYTAARQARF